MSNGSPIVAGSVIRTTGRIAQMPVGEATLGCAVNPLNLATRKGDIM